MIDDLDALLGDISSELFWRRAGLYRVVNPKTGAVAIFPKTAKDVDAWGRKTVLLCAEMFRQGRENAPPPKPLENMLARRVARGD